MTYLITVKVVVQTNKGGADAKRYLVSALMKKNAVKALEIPHDPILLQEEKPV